MRTSARLFSGTFSHLGKVETRVTEICSQVLLGTAFGMVGEETHASLELGWDFGLKTVVQRGFVLLEPLPELLNSVEFVLFCAERNVF